MQGTNQAVPVQVQVTPAAQANTGIQIAPSSTTGTVVPPSGTPVPFVGSGEGLFCPECKNPFANKYSLMKHLRSTRYALILWLYFNLISCDLSFSVCTIA